MHACRTYARGHVFIRPQTQLKDLSSLYIGINVFCISTGHVALRIQKYDSFSNKWYLFTALNSIRSSLDLCTTGYKGGIRGIVGLLPFLNLIHGIDPPSQSFSYIYEKLNQCS